MVVLELCDEDRHGDRDSVGDVLGMGQPTTPRHAGDTDLQDVNLRSGDEGEMVVLDLCDEDGHGGRDSVGNDLGTGQPTTPRHAGDTDLQSVNLRSRDEDGRHGDWDSVGDDLGTGQHQKHPDGFRHTWLGLHGADFVPRNLVGTALFHHQHWDVGVWLFPEPGSVRMPLDVGSWVARAAVRRLGDAGGGEDLGRQLLHHHQQYGYADDEVCPVYRPLRLRGGAAEVDVPPTHSWVEVMGLPMVQTIPETCALVAATVCVEAQHRRKFEANHGPGTFACRAAAPRKLRQACFREKVWNPSTREHERTWDPEKGGHMERILKMMKRLGGVRTTNGPPPAPFLLPLKDWERYSYEDGGLTAETAARLLYERGPCIGTLFATQQFCNTFVIPGSNRPLAVFRGCRREDRKEVKENDPNASMHAVVCYAYCHSNTGRLCIFILDNQRASGPVRCVDFDEFDEFYVLFVKALSPHHLLDFDRFPPLEYPPSGY